MTETAFIPGDRYERTIAKLDTDHLPTLRALLIKRGFDGETYMAWRPKLCGAGHISTMVYRRANNGQFERVFKI